jgi:tryptophan-rich sensory protein
MNMSPTLSKTRYALVAVVTVALAAVIGSLATFPNISTWYARLAKPAFTPPNAVFGPVWTVLYILMAIAFYRVLRLPPSVARGVAVRSFIAQIVCNALWSVAFFGLHSPLAGLVVIALLLIALIICVIAFFRLESLSGWLLTPYLAWASCASARNFAVWRLNP